VGALILLRDVTELRSRERELVTKEATIREIHHRVKNNLQVIASLINMQIRQLRDEHAVAALRECQSRVLTIAQIHEQLYQSNDYAHIPFAEYATTLASNVFRASGGASRGLELALDLDPIELTVETAIPCGLILNELITNSLKHSFPDGRRGRIEVRLRENGPGQVSIGVRDDGVGVPADFKPQSSTSLGMQLVLTLASQLRGTLRVVSESGADFSVTFPT
jgi:two-component sensor histidine kinase